MPDVEFDILRPNHRDPGWVVVQVRVCPACHGSHVHGWEIGAPDQWRLADCAAGPKPDYRLNPSEQALAWLASRGYVAPTV